MAEASTTRIWGLSRGDGNRDEAFNRLARLAIVLYDHPAFKNPGEAIDVFLDQVYTFHRERNSRFALKNGVIILVFEAAAEFLAELITRAYEKRAPVVAQRFAEAEQQFRILAEREGAEVDAVRCVDVPGPIAYNNDWIPASAEGADEPPAIAVGVHERRMPGSPLKVSDPLNSQATRPQLLSQPISWKPHWPSTQATGESADDR